MKKRIIKVVTAWALVLCMTFPTIMSVQAQDDVVGEAIEKEAFMVQHHSLIDRYRGTNFIAPESPDANYLFAGWYQDEDCETALGTTDKAGAAYAKFVHKDVLDVKAQLVSGTNFSTNAADIRFVSTVDSLNYQEVGFDFVIYGQAIPYQSDKVYHKLYAINDAGVVMEEYTPDLFHESSEYFFACIVTGVSNAAFDYEIQATPYWITLDGTKVTAASVTKSISNGYMFKAMDADAELESEISSSDDAFQGGTVRSKYYYLVSSNTEGTKISKLTRNTDATAWNPTPDKESTLSVSDVKDIAYNMTEKLLVMVSGSDSERTITLINRNDLTETTSANITTTTVSLAIESMEHNMNHNKYVVMLDDGSLKILNADFTQTSVVTTVPEALTGYTAQSATADDSYLYQAFSKKENETISNVIAVYDWNGAYVTTIETTLADCEITNIDIVDNTIYAACATEGGIKIYNINILKTFDITYNLAGGTTTNPTGYTVNSGNITLSEPTRYGYDFLGWSEETVSLSEIEWKSGFVDDKNGNTTTTPASGWENAIYSEPIFFKGGMKHTITGTYLPELRWRLFEDATLTSGKTYSNKYAPLTEDRYVVFVLKKNLTEAQLDSLTIQSEYTKQPTLSYTEGDTKKSITLSSWTKGFIEQNVAWKVTYAHADYPNAVYSEEIEVKAGVTYTLAGENLGRTRCRLVPENGDEAVTNIPITKGTFTPETDCKICILLIDGYSENANITIEAGTTGDRSYTANWIRNSFKVKYDANGATGVMEDSIHEFATEKKLSANTFTREGYAFTGWNTAADGSGTTYADEAVIADLTTDESITLYAQWSNENVYTIDYDLKGGSLENGEINPGPIVYAKTTESFTLKTPTRPGYTFKDWKETISLEGNWHSGEVDKDDGSIKAHNTYYYSDLIYLQKGRTYKLNIGIAASNMRWRLYQSDANTTYWQSYTITDGFNPTADSYYVRFMTVPASTEEVRNIATVTSSAPSITIDKGTTANRKYEAVWQGNSYTVAYDGNGAEGTMESSSHVYGTAKALNLNTFTRDDGYAFTGWNTKADGTGTTYGNEASVKNLTTEDGGTVTLYAQWANKDVYTITYDLDGGTLADNESNPTLYAKSTESFTLKEPTKVGYTFAGWEETISLKDSWYSGMIGETSGKHEDHATRYYTDMIYLQQGRTYTLNINIALSNMRWRTYYSTGAYWKSFTRTVPFTPSDASYYVRFMTVPASTEEVRNAATITSSAASITVDKGTTGNRTYKAIWEDVELTNRVVLLSDTHYTTEDSTENTAPLASGSLFGHTQAERIQFALQDVTAFKNKKGSLDAVMILGDLSTDDCGVRSLSTNYVRKFKTDFVDPLSLLSVKSYALAGNHDCYTNAEWQEIFGYERQYVVEVAGAKFIMLDTFEEGDAPDSSGSIYTGIDEECYQFVKAELEQDFSGPIFLCAHNFKMPISNDPMGEEFYTLLKQYPNVQCLFYGHTHKNGVIQSGNLPGKYVVNTGGYAYDPSTAADGTSNYNKFDEAYAWGYQVLEWDDEVIRIYHVKPARTYTDSEGVAHTIEEDLIEGKFVFQWNK